MHLVASIISIMVAFSAIREGIWNAELRYIHSSERPEEETEEPAESPADADVIVGPRHPERRDLCSEEIPEMHPHDPLDLCAAALTERERKRSGLRPRVTGRTIVDLLRTLQRESFGPTLFGPEVVSHLVPMSCRVDPLEDRLHLGGLDAGNPSQRHRFHRR